MNESRSSERAKSEYLLGLGELRVGGSLADCNQLDICGPSKRILSLKYQHLKWEFGSSKSYDQAALAAVNGGCKVVSGFE